MLSNRPKDPSETSPKPVPDTSSDTLSELYSDPLPEIFSPPLLKSIFLIILAIGFKDDIIGVSSGKKLLAQILASLLIIHLGKIHLNAVQIRGHKEIILRGNFREMR